MVSYWGEWNALGAISPYYHWSKCGSGGEPITNVNKTAQLDVGFTTKTRTVLDRENSDSENKGIQLESEKMVIPPYAVNVKHTSKTPNDTTLTTNIISSGGTPDTPMCKNTIIAGVIDVGIPLGHNRWRFKDGKTRLLYAWQMMAPWALKKQSHLPFGAEFSQSDINDLLKKHSGKQCNGWLNEQDFNVDTGLISFAHRQAQRGAAKHASHGAHVLDVVAGVDPHEEEDFQKRVRIIAINAPSTAVFKAAGTHLDAYMFYAIQRIADIADAVWRKNNPNFAAEQKDNPKAVKGYPIVINMSFGKQAGSKDALDEFPAKLARFVRQRDSRGWSKVRFVMPVGNDNLSRCNAMLEPKKRAVEKLNWRILPQDHSANYVEIWGAGAESVPVSISLKSPQSDAQFLDPPNSSHEHQYRDLFQDDVLVARVYLSRISLQPEIGIENRNDEKNSTRNTSYRYVLCTAPTHWANLPEQKETDPDPCCEVVDPAATAPSGLWEIAVKNLSDKRVQCVLSVQTDQALSPTDGVNLRSYFDDKSYERFGENGAPLESYSFPPDAKGNVENQDIRAKTPVRRHGTMNASAAHGVVARVGGYRASDGRPAPYSATGRGRASGQDDGTILGSVLTNGRKGAPTASFPTDDSPAHFGILAAGASNGSVAAMRGTSFASAQGARAIINMLLKGETPKTDKYMLFAAAVKAEETLMHPTKFSDGLIEVLGSGRMGRPDKQDVDRF